MVSLWMAIVLQDHLDACVAGLFEQIEQIFFELVEHYRDVGVSEVASSYAIQPGQRTGFR